MFAHLLQRVAAAGRHVGRAVRRHLLIATKPAAAPFVAGTLADLVRSKSELIAENALLRQQVIVLRRSAKRPRCTPTDRALLVLLASRLRTWRTALLIVQPDTLLGGIGSCSAGSGAEGRALPRRRTGRLSRPRRLP